MRAWRIVSERRAPEAFTGEGARLFGGRWNFPGVSMVYTASHLSLAVLEILVHLRATRLRQRFITFEIEFNDSSIEKLPSEDLAGDWREEPAPNSTREAGSFWVARKTSAVLEVPSVIVPGESNFLLNREHPDYDSIFIVDEAPFSFDPRLIKSLDGDR